MDNQKRRSRVVLETVSGEVVHRQNIMEVSDGSEIDKSSLKDLTSQPEEETPPLQDAAVNNDQTTNKVRRTSIQDIIESSPKCRHESISSDHPLVILLSSPSNDSIPRNLRPYSKQQISSFSQDDHVTCASNSNALAERALERGPPCLNTNVLVHPEPSNRLQKFLPPLSNSKRRIRRRNTSPLRPQKNNLTIPSSRTQSLTESQGSRGLTPLLTSYLRMRGDKPAPGTTWAFNAENQLESFFPNRCIRLYIVTWNMFEMKDLPKSLSNLLLPLEHDLAADMFVIGTQESTPSRKEWEVLIQQTLGPSYVMVQSAYLGAICLCLFLRRDLIWFCSAIHPDTFASRPSTLIKTKGAVAISFTLFGSSFLFITSHLSAGDDKVSERNSEVQKISSNFSLSCDTREEGRSKFDYVFWFGDLNYRVDIERSKANECIAKSDWMSLLVKDQLTKEILQGNIFSGFSELPISFPPSYKFNLHSNQYDTSEKQRVPSWTDRILFKSQNGTGISGHGYYFCNYFKYSDHRAVCGVFGVKLDPSCHIEGVPDCIANFDREIYLRANKQRKVLAEKIAMMEAEPPTEHKSSPTAQKKISSNKKQATSQICLIL